MVSDYEDFKGAADEDTNVVPLFFKKKITVSKGGEKKLTLNAAFKQVIGEALEPLGFIKAKTKYPYYIRFVDNSFIQIIGLKKESENDFNIIAGIATIYRPEINLNCSPRMNCNWLIGVSEIYKRRYRFNFDRKYRISIMRFGFPKNENKYIIQAFENFYRHVNDRDGLFCFELDDPYEIANRSSEIAIKRDLYMAEHNIEGFTKADYIKSYEGIKQSNKEGKEYIYNILNNKNLYDETMEEIKQRKERNIMILRSYGVDI